jgi:hypothetical protein
MYVPEPFKEERIDVLHDAIRRAGLEMNMTNGRLGHFLNRRMASLTIAGAIAACGQTSGGGMFQPGQVIGGALKREEMCSQSRDFSRMPRCSSPAGRDRWRSSTVIRPPISAGTISARRKG